MGASPELRKRRPRSAVDISFTAIPSNLAMGFLRILLFWLLSHRCCSRSAADSVDLAAGLCEADGFSAVACSDVDSVDVADRFGEADLFWTVGLVAVDRFLAFLLDLAPPDHQGRSRSTKQPADRVSGSSQHAGRDRHSSGLSIEHSPEPFISFHFICHYLP
jgi:hypothetical protein